MAHRDYGGVTRGDGEIAHRTQGMGGSVQGTEMLTQGLERCLIGQSTNHLSMRTGMWIS